MRSDSPCEVEQGVHSHAMTGYEDLRGVRGVYGVRHRVTDNGLWSRLGDDVGVCRAEQRKHQ